MVSPFFNILKSCGGKGCILSRFIFIFCLKIMFKTLTESLTLFYFWSPKFSLDWLNKWEKMSETKYGLLHSQSIKPHAYRNAGPLMHLKIVILKTVLLATL